VKVGEARAQHKIDVGSADMRGAGWSSAPSPGFGGRRILVCGKYYHENLIDFVQLACLTILFKPF
jgi:hypothetical protein